MTADQSGATAIATRRSLLEAQLTTVRSGTFRMTDALTDDDLHRQFDPLMSPIVWDMGHIANFEEFWLLRKIAGREARDPVLDDLYNPFDNPRWVRGGLPILERKEATDYLNNVRGEALDVLRHHDLDPESPLLADGYVWSMIAQHEAQHQETVLQALDLRSDLAPYVVAARRRLPQRAAAVDDATRVTIPAGTFMFGTNDLMYAYDNERPAHLIDLNGFAIDKFPVTARRYDEFVQAGGYQNSDHWTEQGREWLAEHGHTTPQGWIPDLDGGWLVRRFGHLSSLDPTEPVEHVNFHEAQAFAAFAGGRLPTELEWEKAAAWDPAAQESRKYPWGETPPTPETANLGRIGWGPAPVGSYPTGASAYGVEQLLGDGYEWTTSHFTGYAGFSTFPYPEYSEVFFGDDYRVLRGASWATSRLVARTTFRNWDIPIRRQIFVGIRLVWDI
ncbi:MAG: ergothioneine biosynthesis protein EgtB [Acidobacteria bacterium]|nr:ergothioneine biosynthesis protein EgtB [Acidobacteriota bacterium]